MKIPPYNPAPKEFPISQFVWEVNLELNPDWLKVWLEAKGFDDSLIDLILSEVE